MEQNINNTPPWQFHLLHRSLPVPTHPPLLLLSARTSPRSSSSSARWPTVVDPWLRSRGRRSCTRPSSSSAPRPRARARVTRPSVVGRRRRWVWVVAVCVCVFVVFADDKAMFRRVLGCMKVQVQCTGTINGHRVGVRLLLGRMEI